MALPKTGCRAGSEAAFVSVPPQIRSAVRSNMRVQLPGHGQGPAPCAVGAVVAAVSCAPRPAADAPVVRQPRESVRVETGFPRVGPRGARGTRDRGCRGGAPCRCADQGRRAAGVASSIGASAGGAAGTAERAAARGKVSQSGAQVGTRVFTHRAVFERARRRAGSVRPLGAPRLALVGAV